MESNTLAASSGVLPAYTSSQWLESQSQMEEASKRILEVLNSGNLSKNKRQLIQDFTQITPAELQEVLNAYFEETIARKEIEDPIEFVKKLSEMIPFELLESSTFSDPSSALKKAKSLLHEAKYHLENSKTKASSSLKSKVSDIIDVILSFIESVIYAFGVADFFQPASTQLQREFRFQKIVMLVSLFSMLSTMLIPLLGVQIAGPIIAGSFLLIAAVSVIYPKIAPAPSHLPCGAINWTKQCQRGEMNSLSFSKGRKDVLDEIANTLIQNMNGQLKKHPLLRGESRVGKNQTAKAFVEAIERGDYPELKGKTVFYLNAADLCKGGDFLEGKGPLEQLSEAIQRHKENIILVIDEIQTPFLSDEHASIGQKLKSMLDAGGDFSYVIGITTSRELAQNISNDVAFVNRFNPITIESTGPEVTQEILAHSVLTKGSSVLCEKEALKLIYQKTAGQPQPYTSDLVLGKCIELTSKKQQSPLVKKIQELKNRKELLASQGAIAPFPMEVEDDITSKIEELTDQIRELKEDLVREEEVFDHLFQKKEQISHVKSEMYRSVLKVAYAHAGSLSRKDEVQLNRFILISRFLAPALNTYLQREAEQRGVKMMIDASVIEEALLSLNRQI